MTDNDRKEILDSVLTFGCEASIHSLPHLVDENGNNIWMKDGVFILPELIKDYKERNIS